ncbi:tubulin polymerization-promoting protein family member 2-like isoform X3 [Mizuhopecten yessoensis]|uniref:Tubulin polymerization-promoting protein family member 3 n=1 Tax=Mizuhopecten yessoensis TaxID=6573 RepID=A0A210QWV7_MIZYE|nr:tubulin polymerization-promoting protein family member 2-like isoform X3 [Mizuhopecten yessoensis]OWF53240.1 Tubulin polymerization-promoting protein family member 3 [Mizuhopecten yessoensis]
MSSGGAELSKVDIKKVKETFRSYMKITSKSASADQINSKAIGKLTKKCWPKELCLYIDTVAFPACKEKGKPFMLINDEKTKDFIGRCASKMRSLGKVPKEASWEAELIGMLTPPTMEGVTKESKTGNVSHFTDCSGYTGTHKERFDDSGKGKGKDGRDDTTPKDGYVQAFKDKGTYDETH